MVSTPPSTTDENLEVSLEPEIAAMLAEIPALRSQDAYEVLTVESVNQRLYDFLVSQGLENISVHGLKRMGGGASKEQFVFDLEATGFPFQRCVLRMDPLESAVHTSRPRESTILKVMADVLPVPPVLWEDLDGKQMGRPALVCGFIGGVVKPTQAGGNVSGLGTGLPKAYRDALSDPFIEHLRAMHAYDVYSPELVGFSVPDADPKQAAYWQLNWWQKVWCDDRPEGVPLMGLAERWLRDNVPAADKGDLVVVHSDYRVGNFLFDEASMEITTILDWELAHIGDFHEDLAWMATHLGAAEDGTLLASGLMTTAELCERYTAVSGRAVSPETFHFYHVLNVYKCVVICLATSAQTAAKQHSHQDPLLSWLSAAGYSFLAQLKTLLEQGKSL